MAESRRAIRRRSRSEWQGVLASGDEVGRFCQREGIHPPTLRWWRWHLAGSGGDDELRARRSELAVVDGSRPSFTECVFRSKATTHSVRRRPLIPFEGDHPFQAEGDRFSP